MAYGSNSAEWSWAGAQTGMGVGDDAMYVGIYDGPDPTDNFLQGAMLTNNPDALALGEVYYIPAGDFAIVQNPGTNETQGMAQRAVMGRVDGTLYYSIHTADPGTTGANLSGLPFVAHANTDYTFADGGTGGRAEANLSAGAIQSVDVRTGGAGYVSGSVTVTATDSGGGTGATFSVTVANSIITAIAVDAGGNNYTAATLLVITNS